MTVRRFKRKSNEDSRLDRVICEMRSMVATNLQKSDLERRRMEKVVMELRFKNTY